MHDNPLYSQKIRGLLFGILIFICLIMFFGPEMLATKVIAVLSLIAGTLAYLDIFVSKRNVLFVIPLIFSVWVYDSVYRMGIRTSLPSVILTIMSFVAVIVLRERIQSQT